MPDPARYDMTRFDLPDLVDRYRSSIEEGSLAILVGAMLFAGVALPSVLRQPKRIPPWVGALLVVPVVVGAILWALELAWISDDAFISFRYARNLVEGRGLVFNPGERVEGYTNFLWTLLMAAGMLLGVHPVQVSAVLGLASLTGVLVLITFIGRKLLPGHRRMTVSLAALGLATSYGFASFATSGLETMFAALLVLVALALAHQQRYSASSLACIAATLAHPDHFLFWTALGAATLSFRPRWDIAKRYAWPVVVLCIWTGWRWWYYGGLLPTTYYAKNVGGSYFDQGAYYVLVSFISSGLLGALPLFVLGAIRGHDLLVVRFTLIATVVYLPYVAKIGGDFMLGRLLVPWMAPYLLVAEVGARDLFRRDRRWRTAAVPAVAAWALVAVPGGIIGPREVYHHIADERTFYALESFTPPKVSSAMNPVRHVFEKYFITHGFRPRVGLRCMGLVAYETGLPIFDDSGLTTPIVARQKLVVRGRPGHEKLATPGHLLQGNVDLADLRIYPMRYDRFSLFRMEDQMFFMAKFHPEVVDRLLETPNVVIQDVRAYIDELASRPDPVDDQTACDLWFVEQFYFRWVTDELRRDRVARALAARDPEVAPVADLLLGSLPSSMKPVVRFGFDQGALEDWEVAGIAFEDQPRTGEVAGQQATYGYRGAYITSFHRSLRDEAHGTLSSPEFVLDGDVLTLQISGGEDRSRVGARLLVNDEAVRTVTGCGSELMGRRTLHVAPWRGQRARLEIYDNATGPWGHIALDEVVLWDRHGSKQP